MSLRWNRLLPSRVRTWLFWYAVIWAHTWCAVGFAAPAASVLVAVRSADQSDPAPYELRLRSELSTVGMVAIVVNPLANPGDTRTLATKFGANTTLDVVVSATEVTAAIWSTDPQLGLEVTRIVRVSTRERDAVAVFALRTVDFLEGARLELEQQRQAKLIADAAERGASANSSQTATSTSPSATKTKTKSAEGNSGTALRSRSIPSSAEPPATPEVLATRWNERLRLGVAFNVLRTTDRFAWATSGSASLAWIWHPHYALGVTASGPYLNHIRGSSDEYTVTVDQETLIVSLRRRIALGTRLQIEPNLGVGGARYSAAAAAKPPRIGYRATAWSLLSQGGVGLVWCFGNHFRILADLGVLVHWYTPRVKVDGQDVTGSSPVSAVVSLGPGWAI